ncbi:DNA damage-inducible protein, partial [Globisporangium splendens]
MQLTITSTEGDVVGQISVDPHQTTAAVAAQLQQQFEQAGVKDGDLLVIMSSPNAPAAVPAPSSLLPNTRGFTVRPGMKLHEIPPAASPEVLLEIVEKNPQLMPEQVRMVLMQIHMEAASRRFKEQEEVRIDLYLVIAHRSVMALERNPFDAAAQAAIEERIRLNNVQQNMEIAIEEMPEAFGHVSMLYIPCEVNGTQVKAFVDSGAQSTIMSSNCAERCGIMRLVDKRFAGQAVGVGTAKIIGRVHMASLKIGDNFYNCSFTILDQQSVDFLFGLDMLKRHLEIPVTERAGGAPPQQASSSAVAPPAAAAQHSNAASGDETHQQKVERLVALGFDQQREAYRDDLYEILGLEPAADEKEVARAYKKKSLLHHPDRGGDGSKTVLVYLLRFGVKKFLELKHARDILLDPKKKEQYDKKLSQELMAKKKQREREAELDSKRRQMRDELLRKEQSHELKHKHKKESAGFRNSDLNKLREKGLARQKEMEERLARDARRRKEMDELKETLAANASTKSQRTVTVKWDRKQFSHSDETLSHEFRAYGEIESIKMKSASAKIIFATAAAAAKSVRVEGHKPSWREVSIQGHIVEAEDHADAASPRGRSYSTDVSAGMLPGGWVSLDEHLEFEQRVLAKLRERALQQQQTA